MKIFLLLTIFINVHLLTGQVIINPDGSHSIDIGNGVVINPDGTHSVKLESGVVINPDGTHSIAVNPHFIVPIETQASVTLSQKQERNKNAELVFIELLKNKQLTNKECQLIMNGLWENDPLIDIFLQKTIQFQKGHLSASGFNRTKKIIIEILTHKNQNIHTIRGNSQ